MKEQIREIIERNQKSFMWVADANTHAAEEIEKSIVKHQTNSLLIAMLESQLKVENIILETIAFKNSGIDYTITSTKIKELERQLKELKG